MNKLILNEEKETQDEQMKSEEQRDFNNYFGQTANPFIILSQFELSKDSLRLAFDGFASTNAFDSGDEPLPNLRRDFFIQGDKFRDFRIANGEVFESIKTKCLEIAEVSDNYNLIYMNLLIHKAVLVINVERSKKDDNIVRTKTSPEYHQIIENNSELVSQVLDIAWSYGKKNDLWLKSLSPIIQNK